MDLERGSYIQAFVQLEDVRQAMKAKEQFDGNLHTFLYLQI